MTHRDLLIEMRDGVLWVDDRAYGLPWKVEHFAHISVEYSHGRVTRVSVDGRRVHPQGRAT